ncbi:MAG: response regulator [Blastocatellia bacterium]|nr:response regulator [Blastocatellia bacterium]MBK6427008.1 response regulator [Blastocatellia bacterium]
MSGGPVICIVDDDPSVRRALARLVRSCGLPVETHASAEEYLDAQHADGVACVVLDVHLGHVSGLDLRERIVAQPVHPPVILMTAHDDAVTRERIAKCGAPGYLRKPFEATALLTAISTALGRDLEPPPI